jgi:hypothetical protein
VARDIDRKLRATSAALGAMTLKDLAAAFRRVNPATSFDIDRAHKWMQGRAQPRELRLYEDWAKLVDLGQPGAWIADCGLEEFVDAVCARHGADRASLEQRLQSSRRPAARGRPEASPSIAGTYACYSHAWSPYFAGRLIRGELTVAPPPGAQRLVARYAERLPTGRLELEGAVETAGRVLYVDLREAGGDAHMFLSLFAPTPPASVIVGFLCGATFLDPDAQPSMTRIVMVRLPAPSPGLRSAVAYLAAEASVAGDLAGLGLPIADPAAVDRGVAAFLAGGRGGGLDQIDLASYRALVDLLNPIWLAGAMAAGAGEGEG